ncbi:hypothetical protein [Bartonella raoultii]|uniref:Phage protein n=1 Tax=Bartonella raoultii TaxID=1457020 RepID=A0ABS7I7K4_9HYPH|nr:hypothetical protein [Bartonella raoultii]MBX4335603.1 hypothetical protein [Bartonella raoultii]MBX4335680.1 hypothetical protein [Bartonella raoultii]MBX4336019.1 hypothetical protein [Bartonella raoultii]MBX4336498.1 hypothetical protein [Bartonella raoultii]MBX4336610.1 hypothetical protein [Bartonella raoultii]
MNAELNEGLNEDYGTEASVFDDEGSFESAHDRGAVESDDVSSSEPVVAKPVQEPSEITIPNGEQQRAVEQANQAREALTKFYEAQSQMSQVDGKETPPNPSEDIIGYMGWMGKKLQEQDAYIRAQQDVQRQALEYQEFNGHLNQFLESSVTSVKDKYSDFDAAADFLYETRAKQLNAWSSIYPTYAQKSTIDAIIGDELRTIVATCAQKGVNPAEELYRIAQNLGYQKQAVQANDQIAALQNRQNSARTLTGSGGGGRVGPMTKEVLANMSEKEFDAWISNPKNEARFYEIMGVDPD